MDEEEDELPYVRPALPVDGEPDFESVCAQQRLLKNCVVG